MPSTSRRDFLVSTAGLVAAAALVPSRAHASPRLNLHAPASVALIGVGRHGRALIGELQKLADQQVTIAALCDTDPARLDGGLRRAPGAKGYADYRELLDKHPDALVIIATPTHLHRAIALDAIQAGRHVFCEAPLAHTLEDTRAIVAAARSSRAVFQPGLYARSNPVYQLARTFFRSDSVRDLISMRAQHHQKSTWRTPASDPAREREINWQLDPELSLGLAGEIGVHQLDVFHWYLSAYPTSVRAGGSIRLHNDGRTVHDTIHADLAFDSGAILQYHATLANSFEGRHEVLHGSNASIKLAWTHGWMFKEADAPTQGWEVYANRQQFHNDEGITLIADATKLAAQGKLKEGIGLPHSAAYYALADFIKAAAANTPPACTADEGGRATIVAILAAQAVRSGNPTPIDPAILTTL